MKKSLPKLFAATALIAGQIGFTAQAQTVSTFESLSLPAATFENLTLSSNSFWNGSAVPNGTTFESGNSIFPNNYDGGFGYWLNGWAYSNVQDSVTAGFGNLYAASTAIGYNNSANYAVGQNGSVINLDASAIGKAVNGFYITNSTYAAISMRDGDAFAKKFGGATGDDADWFKLTIRKWMGGLLTNDSVEFYLADFRFTDNTQDYIVKTWEWVDLSSLGNVDSLSFTLSSSDVGTFGMNTPGFFCIDNFNVINYWNGSAMPNGTTFTDGNAIFQNNYNGGFGYWESGWAYSNVQDSITANFSNLYAAIPAIGYNNSANYAVGQNNAIINLNATAIAGVVSGMYITNSTYAALSMRDGDAFAKKFGGATGDDADWFKLTIRKWMAGVLTNDSVEFYLADFRFTDNTQDYIVKTWEWVDLSSLGNVDSLSFTLSSSDVGTFGMNTPAFFCMDDFTTADIPTALIANNSQSSAITLYPNPANETVHINLSNLNDKNVFISIADVTGKTVYSQALNTLTTVSLNISNFTNGVYFVTINGDNTHINSKLIKN